MSVEIMTEVWKYSAIVESATMFVLVALADHADERRSCFPGVPRLARMTRMTERSVRRHLRTLEDLGEITTEQRAGHSSRYVIRDYLTPDTVSGGTGCPGDSVSVPPRTNATAPRTGCPPTPDRVSAITIKEPSTEPSGEPSPAFAPGSFQEFWGTYPVHKARGGAERAWLTALKKTSAKTIIAGAQRFRDDPNRVDEYTKHPSTWLNQECWDDDPLPARGQRRPESRATQVMNTAAAWAQREEAKLRETQAESPIGDDVIVDGEIVGGENDSW